MKGVRAPQDLGAAFLFSTVGIAGLIFGSNLRGMQSPGELGSGTMPFILSWLCIGFGILMLVRAIRIEGPAIALVPWRGMTAITVSMIVFALGIERMGYLPVAIAVPFIASLALPQVRWFEAVLVSVLLGSGAAFLFIYLLGQPMPVLWGAN